MFRKTALCLFAIGVVASALTFPFLSFSQTGHSRALVTQRIDESKLITLGGNTHPFANSANDRGVVADDFKMEDMLLQLRRPAEQEQALEKRIEGLTDLHSANYHQWLTAKEYGETYGLAASDITTITSWLESHGFTVHGAYPNGVLIAFSGTAGQVRETFHTEIHNLEVDGVKHISNMSDPKIPAAFADAVIGVVSLNDFMPRPLYKPKANYTIGGGTFAVVPGDLGVIYNLNPLFTGGTTGAGQTIVVIEDTNVFKTTDWNTFRTTFGVTGSGTFTQVHPTGTATCTNPGTNGDEIEAILDAEYASAAAPSAAIELASCSDTSTFGGLLAVENLINGANPPAIMSISYGFCEAFNGAAANAAFNLTYQQAAGEGVSVFVSSGDESAVSCDANQSKATHGIGVSGFTSTPYNVSVGGTDYGDTFAGTTSTYWNSTNTSTFESAKSYVPEIPWNDSCASELIATFHGVPQTYGSTGFCNTSTGEEFLTTGSGSGGPSGCATGTPSISGVVSGTCAGYAKPSWQSGFAGIVADGVRDIPDVSLFAANGVWGHYFPFCDSDPADGGTCSGAPSGWLGAGGTSFSSPIMAGIQALVNQKTGSSQGNPNPTLYSLAATEYGATGNAACNSTLGNGVASTCIFYDVTQGDFDVNCTGTHNCYTPSGTNGVTSTSNTAYQPAYVATTGWDFTTGIGTVNAANLVNAWPVSTSPSFTLGASPSSLSIAQGSNMSSTITVTPKNGFSGTVTFSASGLPTGVTAAFNPTSSATSSVVTLTASATATTGTSTVTIMGTSGALTATTTISLTITGTGGANFTLSASPASLTVNKGAAGRSVITVTPSGGFTGSVAFSASGVPTGVTATFTPTSSTTTSRLGLTVGTSAVSGTYTITVKGTSGSLTNTTTVSLTVAGSTGGGSFTLSASPATVSITPGGTGGTSTITVTPSGGFTGTVTFSISALPSGVSASFNPTSSTTSSVLTLTASSGAAAGKFALTVTGTSGSTTATVALKLAVQ